MGVQHPTMLLFFFLFFVVKATYADEEKPRFKADAESKVSWKIPTKRRSEIGDVSKIDLSWEPSDMLENIQITNDGVGVEMRSGDGEFIPVVAEPTKKSAKWKYNIERIPCENQTIRFFAENPAGKAYSNFTIEIPASTTDEIKKAIYEPSPPRDVSGTSTRDKLTVSWERSKCAEDYNVDLICYKSKLDELPELKDIEVVVPTYTHLLTADQKECTEWEVEVIAFLGEKYSEEARIRVSYSDDDNSDDDNSDDDISAITVAEDVGDTNLLTMNTTASDEKEAASGDTELLSMAPTVVGWKVLGVLALGLVLLA